jgi:hypothetical protein
VSESAGAGGGIGGAIVNGLETLPGAGVITGITHLLPGGVTSIPGEVGGAVTGAVDSAASAAFGWVEPTLLRGAKIILGTGLVLVGLYLIARSFNAVPSPTQVAQVVTRGGGGGAGAASGAPRRRGDAAADRGDQVTQAGQPRATTRREARSDARQDRAAARRADAAFGEVPF